MPVAVSIWWYPNIFVNVMTVSFQGHRVGVATASLGMHPSHTLEAKLQAIREAGFRYCEVGFGDYMGWVRTQYPQLPESTAPFVWSEAGEPDPSDDQIWSAMYDAAPRLVSYAASLDITILMLQPMNQFDGWPEGSKRDEWAKGKAVRWMKLCSLLRVEAIQVGSNDYAEANAPDIKTARDLHWLAEVGASESPPVKIAYEPWAFSKRVSTFEHAWKLVEMGNHDNLGLCLDTALLALAPDYGFDVLEGRGWQDEKFTSMLSRIKMIPVEKIFYVELSDVLTPSLPLGKGSRFDGWKAENDPPRGDIFTWCICARSIPLLGEDAGRRCRKGDDLGGARVAEILSTFLQMGYKGPLMFEPFEALSMEKGDPDVPEIYARGCARSLELLNRDVSTL